ncbi:MAG: hypothetical protein IPN16_17065 [Gemmatimonadetes bacterium]|nr:hypothetical protein [Gemmatimonadota bacterium]
MPRFLRTVIAAYGIAVLSSGSALAQRQPTMSSGTPTPYNPRLYSDPTATNKAFKSLRWRLIGPFRGGRVDAVAGDPTKPLVYYMGAVNGGVWKTTNAGISWENLTDGKSDISSVGAITVAPSDANVIYVGTGESQLREDLTFGTGMYRSTDAGQTWQHLGLTETHQVTAIRVHHNADLAYVSAIGHAFGPNAERGVFRTVDGGKSWKKVLFIDDSTGVHGPVDGPHQPARPLRLDVEVPAHAVEHECRRRAQRPLEDDRRRRHLADLSGNPGMPKAPLGKIGIAVSPANPRRLFASIEAKDTLGGIFRSDDAGASWERMNDDARLWVRNWYYSTVTADPKDENTVYVMNLQVLRSIDGGRPSTRCASRTATRTSCGSTPGPHAADPR